MADEHDVPASDDHAGIDQVVRRAFGTVDADSLDRMIRAATSEPQDAVEPIAIRLTDDPVPEPAPDGGAVVDLTTDRPARPGRRRGGWLLAVAAAVVVLGVAVAVVRTADDGVTANRSTSTMQRPPTTAPAHTTTTAGSNTPGVQPGVIYDVPGVANTSPSLDRELADAGAIFAPFGANPTVLPSNATLQLERTPATLRYEAYNPAPNAGCKAFLSRPVTVTGTWGRLVTPNPESLFNITVINLRTRAQAAEAYVTFSLGQSPTLTECSGFNPGGSGVADYSKLDVRHQDPQLDDLPEDLRYNAWLRPAGPDFPQYAYGLAGVIQRGRTLVLFGVVTTKEAGPPDPRTTTQVLNNVLDRI